MSVDCTFCDIVSGVIPTEHLASDPFGVVVADIHPQAPTHLLIIPKLHIRSLAEVTEAEWPTIGRVLGLAARAAHACGLDQSGYRTVINSGLNAGQTVDHLHIHLLAGRPMLWPPG